MGAPSVDDRRGRHRGGRALRRGRPRRERPRRRLRLRRGHRLQGSSSPHQNPQCPVGPAHRGGPVCALRSRRPGSRRDKTDSPPTSSTASPVRARAEPYAAWTRAGPSSRPRRDPGASPAATPTSGPATPRGAPSSRPPRDPPASTSARPAPSTCFTVPLYLGLEGYLFDDFPVRPALGLGVGFDLISLRYQREGLEDTTAFSARLGIELHAGLDVRFNMWGSWPRYGSSGACGSRFPTSPTWHPRGCPSSRVCACRSP